MNTTIKNLEWRYACKKFDENKKLSTNQIYILKKAFNLTPTSFGLQPIKLIVIENDDLKSKLLPHAYYQKKITTCSHLLILCIDKTVNSVTIDEYYNLEMKTRGTSEEIIDKFRTQLKDMYAKMSKEDIEKSSVNQAYIALGNLMTVCAMEKIDSCPMEGFNQSKIDEELNLDAKGLKSILLLPVGFRAEDDFMHSLKKVRKSIENIVVEL